jgi:hypothetical protein
MKQKLDKIVSVNDMNKQDQDNKLVEAGLNLIPNEFIHQYLVDNSIDSLDKRLSDKIMGVIDRHYDQEINYKEIAETINHVKMLVIQSMFLGTTRNSMNLMREEFK